VGCHFLFLANFVLLMHFSLPEVLCWAEVSPRHYFWDFTGFFAASLSRVFFLDATLLGCFPIFLFVRNSSVFSFKKSQLMQLKGRNVGSSITGQLD
jgi:hypothetical protein